MAAYISLLYGHCVLLACFLLHVCAQLGCRDKDWCHFCWRNLVFDMLLGERNEKWPFTTWNKEKKPSHVPKAWALFLIESNLLHAEYVGLVSIWLRKCTKHSQFLSKHSIYYGFTEVTMVVSFCIWKKCTGNSEWNWGRSPENLV